LINFVDFVLPFIEMIGEDISIEWMIFFVADECLVLLRPGRVLSIEILFKYLTIHYLTILRKK